MMKNELKVFFTAVMFYTRIPVPKWTGYSPENLNKATRYFPFIGIIVGGVGAGIFFLTSQVLSVYGSLFISISAMILLTGAFHEDAFADFCDGFGGGYTRDKVLTIMKDSRIGTFGAVGIILLLLGKFFLLADFDTAQIPFILIAAHSFSRVNPVLLIFSSKYIRDTDDSKSKPVGTRSTIGSLITAILIGLLPLYLLTFILFPAVAVTAIVCVQLIIWLLFRMYVHRRIQGYTGDVLGALQQISEIGMYLTCLVLLKFL